ncbi:MAG: sigma-70 family RNA polymerase sigma factor [Polyangiaceae bacterium]
MRSSEDSLAAYRREVAALPRLSAEAEIELVERARAGDRGAASRLVTSCLGLVVAIALEYRRWGVPLEDIVQQGNIGLLKAALKFDPTRGVRLATYAAYWVRAEIRTYVVRTYRVVRVGTTKAERRAMRAYRTSAARDVDSLSKLSGLSPERVERLLPILSGREASLDASLGDSEVPLVDLLRAEDATPEESVREDERHARARTDVATALGVLSDRERMIIEERFFTESPPTLNELGERLGISKERVRQLEERARGKLRRELEPRADDYRAAC